MKICAVVLAAGAASRMGCPKQLLLINGQPLVRYVTQKVCKAIVDKVFLVTGAYRLEVEQAVAQLPVCLLHNSHWTKGQSESIRAAVNEFTEDISAVVFVLADQPFVNATLINKLVQAYKQRLGSIIVPKFNQKKGNPVLFDLAIWRQKLMNIQGDKGAREIIAANPSHVAYVEVGNPDLFLDIDTQDDYQRIIRKTSLVEEDLSCELQNK